MVMDTMKIQTTDLIRLLDKVQRKHSVAGSTQPQVSACMLRGDGTDEVSVTSLVKDGVTSVFRFSASTRPQTEMEEIPIPDIDRIKGVLKYHGGILDIKYVEGKLRLKSGKKSTTILASGNARAFPHSPHTIAEWEQRSLERARAIDSESHIYTTRDGSQITPVLTVSLDSVELFEALRCASMNSQKDGIFTFILDENVLSVRVGEDLKGSTTTVLWDDVPLNRNKWEAKFKGGLDHLMKYINGQIFVSFFDFRNFNQGIAMLITHGKQDFNYQAGALE